MLFQIINTHFKIFRSTNKVKAGFIADKLSGHTLQAYIFHTASPVIREEELHFITIEIGCHFVDNGHIKLNLFSVL